MKKSLEVSWDGGDGKRHDNEHLYMVPFVSFHDLVFKYVGDFLIFSTFFLFLNQNLATFNLPCSLHPFFFQLGFRRLNLVL